MLRLQDLLYLLLPTIFVRKFDAFLAIWAEAFLICRCRRMP